MSIYVDRRQKPAVAVDVDVVPPYCVLIMTKAYCVAAYDETVRFLCGERGDSGDVNGLGTATSDTSTRLLCLLHACSICGRVYD